MKRYVRLAKDELREMLLMKSMTDREARENGRKKEIKCFEVRKNGELLCCLGLPGAGTFEVTVISLVGAEEACQSDEAETQVHVTGWDSEDRAVLRWLKAPLAIGDSVSIDVVETQFVDEPQERHSSARTSTVGTKAVLVSLVQAEDGRPGVRIDQAVSVAEDRSMWKYEYPVSEHVVTRTKDDAWGFSERELEMLASEIVVRLKTFSGLL